MYGVDINPVLSKSTHNNSYLHRPHLNSVIPSLYTVTILEGALVDPAYSWPPADGVGKHALEVVSKGTGSTEEDDLAYPEVPKVKAKRKVITETEITTSNRCGGLLKCCRSEEAVVNTHVETLPVDEEEKERLRQNYFNQRDDIKNKRRERLMKKEEEEKYNMVPEGVLVYRLDTKERSIVLISAPNSNTDMRTLMTEMVVVDAVASRNSNMRGILVTGDTGEQVEIITCEQRTATSWMEAINMMLGKGKYGSKKLFGKNKKEQSEMEEQYLNLTAYSNNLLRTDAIPSHKGKKKTTGGIYYVVAKREVSGETENDEELEEISRTKEKEDTTKSLWDAIFTDPNEAFDLIMDPNKKEREEETRCMPD